MPGPNLKQTWIEYEIAIGNSKVVHRYGAWPKQVEAHGIRARHVVYGGARGPGKTRWLCEHILRAMLRWPGIPVLLLRKDLKDLKLTTEREWQSVCPPQLYDPKYGGQYHKGERWYRFPNSSFLQLGELKDWESYKSATVGLIGIDELNEVEREAYINLDPALRWTTGKGVCTYPECATLGEEYAREHPVHPYYQIIAATNPSPGWVKEEFWEPWKYGHERPGNRFVSATAFDNPSLPPDFIPSLLKTNTATWVRNYIYGDWSAFENMVWPRWNRPVHTWRGPRPPFVRIEGGIDYGATTQEAHRTTAYLTGQTREGFEVTFWEYSKQGAASNDFFETLSMAQKQFRPERWSADGSQHRANELLRSTGIPVYDAPRYDGAVKDGINLIDRLMTPNAAGRPGIYITEDCPRLMSGIETYQLDPKTGKPLPNQEDDEVNAWRYNIMGITQGRLLGASAPLAVSRPAGGAVPTKASATMTAIREAHRKRLAAAIQGADTRDR